MTEYSMKQWALAYANKGLAVFPLWEKSKKPMTANGCKDATADINIVKRWWETSPNANIGIATGSRSGGLVVIDLDIDEEKGKDGYGVFRDWEKEHGELPDTWRSITGRGGYHLFYKDSATNRNKTNLYDGVDIRGEGGYVVAPPSVHPNGRRYEWELSPEEFPLVEVDTTVIEFLRGDIPDAPPQWEKPQRFQCPVEIPDGDRTKALISVVGSMKGKCFPDKAIRAAVLEINADFVPPLTEDELRTEVFPSLKNLKEGDAPYYKPVRGPKLDCLTLIPMKDVEEKEPEWLVRGYIPKAQISILAGDGGSGKTTAWCAITAAISDGKFCFLEGDVPFSSGEPKKVLFFSSEDSAEYTLRGRLRRNGANLENIYSMSISDERFQDLKFDSPLLEALIKEHRPELVVFDPIQSFIPPETQMGQRNAMRACLNPLIGLGEQYGVTFLIIVHTNKQSGMWGRKRIADSADIWDIARSVLIAGEADNTGLRYISHEKCNYGPQKQTVLFRLDSGAVEFAGFSPKKDKDFVMAAAEVTRQAPQREDAKTFILDYLKGGEVETSELDAAMKAMGISNRTLERAKSELKNEGRIKYQSRGFGKEKKFYCLLRQVPIPSDEVAE